MFLPWASDRAGHGCGLPLPVPSNMTWQMGRMACHMHCLHGGGPGIGPCLPAAEETTQGQGALKETHLRRCCMTYYYTCVVSLGPHCCRRHGWGYHIHLYLGSALLATGRFLWAIPWPGTLPIFGRCHDYIKPAWWSQCTNRWPWAQEIPTSPWQ